LAFGRHWLSFGFASFNCHSLSVAGYGFHVAGFFNHQSTIDNHQSKGSFSFAVIQWSFGLRPSFGYHWSLDFGHWTINMGKPLDFPCPIYLLSFYATDWSNKDFFKAWISPVFKRHGILQKSLRGVWGKISTRHQDFPEKGLRPGEMGDEADYFDWYAFAKLLDRWRNTQSAIRSAIQWYKNSSKKSKNPLPPPLSSCLQIFKNILVLR